MQSTIKLAKLIILEEDATGGVAGAELFGVRDEFVLAAVGV